MPHTRLVVSPMHGRQLGMQPSTQRGTATCSALPAFTLEDYQTGPHYHQRHALSIDEHVDAVVVAFYYAD